MAMRIHFMLTAALAVLLLALPGCGGSDEASDSADQPAEQAPLAVARVYFEVRDEIRRAPTLLEAITDQPLTENSVTPQTRLMLSDPVLQRVLRDPRVLETKWYASMDDDADRAIGALLEDVRTVEHVRDTQVFRAQATTEDGDDALAILGALTDAYLRELREELVGEVRMHISRVDRQIQEHNQRIQRLDLEMRRFTNDGVNVAENAIRERRLLEELSRLQITRDTIDAQLEAIDPDSDNELQAAELDTLHRTREAVASRITGIEAEIFEMDQESRRFTSVITELERQIEREEEQRERAEQSKERLVDIWEVRTENPYVSMRAEPVLVEGD